MYKICQCCGDLIHNASALQPNVCLGCEQVLEDDSPTQAAHLQTAHFEEPVLFGYAASRRTEDLLVCS